MNPNRRTRSADYSPGHSRMFEEKKNLSPLLDKGKKFTVSIITVVYNNSATIRDAIESVLSQKWPNIEYIIIDGGSTDGTLDVVRSYAGEIAHVVSEPDKGIYDAMNKGIRLATGDVVGMLNSDDFYTNDDVIGKIVNTFADSGADSVFADLLLVNQRDINKIVRYCRSDEWTPEKFVCGWMPNHPTFFVKRRCYEEYGLYKTTYKIASDFELLIRFFVHYKISYQYIPEILVKQRMGGASTRGFRSNWILNNEIVRACHENQLQTNIGKVYLKYFKKIKQLFIKPPAI